LDVSSKTIHAKLQFVTTTSLNGNIDEKRRYVIHSWWHPLMIDNQVSFAIIFATIYIYDQIARGIFAIVIQSVRVNLLATR
jgi:hypothetical protein